MKTLIISGSPRKYGDSMTLVNEMLKYLNGEVQTIYAVNDLFIGQRYLWFSSGTEVTVTITVKRGHSIVK